MLLFSFFFCWLCSLPHTNANWVYAISSVVLEQRERKKMTMLCAATNNINQWLALAECIRQS